MIKVIQLILIFLHDVLSDIGGKKNVYRNERKKALTFYLMLIIPN